MTELPGTDVRVVLITTPDPETATRLARALVEEGLAACGNILSGLRSIYRWQGNIEDATEALLMLKTTAAQAEALATRAVALHPYEVPEVLVLPVESGHGPYLDWVRRGG